MSISTEPKNKCLIAVHSGAGYHSVTKETEYKSSCAQACKKAMAILKKGASAVEAVTVAIQYLEDCVCTNAGVGSSLTLDGTVECDASIMDGATCTFGAVGAVSGVKNPILVASKLLEEQQKGLLCMGRIPPCTLVGAGAHTWAKNHKIPTVQPQCMKSESSIKTFENHKRRLQTAEERLDNKRRKHLTKGRLEPVNTVDAKYDIDAQITSKPDTQHMQKEDQLQRTDGIEINESEIQDTEQGTNGTNKEGIKDNDTCIQDTVGAVCIDVNGNIAAGASSGGISLKQPGRLGPAAMYGAGCWACNWRSDNKPGVAVATSGTGEHLIKTLLAKECAERWRTGDNDTDLIKDTFLESEYLQNTGEKYGGILALKLDQLVDGARHCELQWSHTTASMCVGYMTSHTKPKTLISRLEDISMAGKSYIMEAHAFKL